MTASIDLWSADDTASMIPWVVAGLAVALCAWQTERRTSRRQLRIDLQRSENDNRQLAKENRRLRWENDMHRGVVSPAHHIGVSPHQVRTARTYRAPAALPPAWTQPDPDDDAEPASWPATVDTATTAIVNDPAPGDDTEPFPFGALTAGADHG